MQSSISTNASERFAHIIDQKFRLFRRREVTSAIELSPVDKVLSSVGKAPDSDVVSPYTATPNGTVPPSWSPPDWQDIDSRWDR
jgi:hypothetical protein